MIRTILVVIAIILYIIFTLPVLIYMKLTDKNNFQRNTTIANKTISGFCRIVLFLCGARVTVTGKENLPDEPVLFVANHRSYFDIVTAYAFLPVNCGFVAKKEMLKVPMFPAWMRSLRCFFLDRNDIRQGLQVILAAADQVKEGTSVWIFPEGTRFQKEEPDEFKGGSCKIAEKAKCKIIPVAFQGTDNIFEQHVPFIKSAKVTMHYCPPIDPAELSREDKRNLAGLAREEIITAIKGETE